MNSYDDGSFRILFKNAAFSKFTTHDSSVQFLSEEKMLLIFNWTLNNFPIKISIKENNLFIVFDSNQLVLSPKDFPNNVTKEINGIIFSFTQNGISYNMEFLHCQKLVNLKIGEHYIDKKWILYWEMITIENDSLSLNLGYNPFHPKGPETIHIQDEQEKFGISIHHSLRTNKKVRYIEPIFYNISERKAFILGDFLYRYNFRGRLKMKTSKNKIKYCDSKTSHNRV